MTAAHWNAVLLGATAGGLALVARIIAVPLVHVTVPELAVAAAAPLVFQPRAPRESLAGAIITRDPFRVMRRAAPVTYDPLRPTQPATPPPPKPALALDGIVWDGGREPVALVEGLPGTDGPRPVRRGDTVGALHIKAIGTDRVVIVGLDTSWTLTVRQPWR